MLAGVVFAAGCESDANKLKRLETAQLMSCLSADARDREGDLGQPGDVAKSLRAEAAAAKRAGDSAGARRLDSLANAEPKPPESAPIEPHDYRTDCTLATRDLNKFMVGR